MLVGTCGRQWHLLTFSSLQVKEWLLRLLMDQPVYTCNYNVEKLKYTYNFAWLFFGVPRGIMQESLIGKGVEYYPQTYNCNLETLVLSSLMIFNDDLETY